MLLCRHAAIIFVVSAATASLIITPIILLRCCLITLRQRLEKIPYADAEFSRHIAAASYATPRYRFDTLLLLRHYYVAPLS